MSLPNHDPDVLPTVAVLTLTEGQKVAVYQTARVHGQVERYEAVMVVTGGVLKLAAGSWRLVKDEIGENDET